METEHRKEQVNSSFLLAMDLVGKAPTPTGGESHTHPQLGAHNPRPSHTNPPHLAHGHSKDAGVQQARGRVGTHLTHKSEPLPPPHTILLYLLPAETGQMNTGQVNTWLIRAPTPTPVLWGQGLLPECFHKLQ